MGYINTITFCVPIYFLAFLYCTLYSTAVLYTVLSTYYFTLSNLAIKQYAWSQIFEWSKLHLNEIYWIRWNLLMSLKITCLKTDLEKKISFYFRWQKTFWTTWIVSFLNMYCLWCLEILLLGLKHYLILHSLKKTFPWFYFRPLYYIIARVYWYAYFETLLIFAFNIIRRLPALA